MRSLVYLAILLMAVPAQTAVVHKRKYPCKTPELAASCYWTHGRLAEYNGGPPNTRLWKIGTHRIVGIYSGPGVYPRNINYDADPELPSNLELKFKGFQTDIYADFEVCPLEHDKPGEMRAVCIEAAKNIVVKEFKDR